MKLFQGQYHNWEEHLDDKSPCALTCKSSNNGIVAQLASKVIDGTRCRKDSLDMCIDGECQVSYSCRYGQINLIKFQNRVIMANSTI